MDGESIEHGAGKLFLKLLFFSLAPTLGALHPSLFLSSSHSHTNSLLPLSLLALSLPVFLPPSPLMNNQHALPPADPAPDGEARGPRRSPRTIFFSIPSAVSRKHFSLIRTDDGGYPATCPWVGCANVMLLITDESVNCERCGLHMKLQEGHLAVQESMCHLVVERIRIKEELATRRANLPNRRESQQPYKQGKISELIGRDLNAIAAAADLGVRVRYD